MFEKAQRLVLFITCDACTCPLRTRMQLAQSQHSHRLVLRCAVPGGCRSDRHLAQVQVNGERVNGTRRVPQWLNGKLAGSLIIHVYGQRCPRLQLLLLGRCHYAGCVTASGLFVNCCCTHHAADASSTAAAAGHRSGVDLAARDDGAGANP